MGWNTIKKTAIDVWDELLLLMIFNLIWIVGTALVIPFPFVTFSLFFIIKDVGEGRGISMAKFFNYGRQTLRPAYIWGGINLVLYALVFINLAFYAGIDANWASVVRMIITSLVIFWSVIQLMSLPLYPRLVEPSFKLAARNAAVVIGRHPGRIIVLLIVIVLILVGTSIIVALPFLISFSLVAMLMNNVTEVIIDQELDRKEVES